MDPISLQKGIRDNAEDLQNYLKDLKNWESEMKRKENELCTDSSNFQPGPTNQGAGLPPIRNKIRKTGKEIRNKETHSLSADAQKIIPKKNAYCDYASWDKFDVDKACQDIDAGTEESEDESESEEEDIETQRQHEEAIYEKEKGNKFVKSQKWKDAILCYNRAIECYPYDAVFYANRALCYLKTSDLKSAETDCTSALNLDISYVKAFQRRAAARMGLGMLEEARADLKNVLRLEPKNVTSWGELAKIEKKINAMKKETKCLINQERKVDQGSGEPLNAGTNSNLSSEGKKADQGNGEQANAGANLGFYEDDYPIIEPIYKPPHLRSKKPSRTIDIKLANNTDRNKKLEDLKEIETIFTSEVTESHTTDSKVIDSGEGKMQGEKNKTNLTSKIIDVDATSLKIVDTVEEKLQRVPLGTKAMDEQKTAPVTSIQQTQETMDIPPPPNSYVEFYVGWKKVKRGPKQRFLYLKQIPGGELSKIFQESLESTTFSELISTLETGFLPAKEPVYPYLLGMSNVKRLSALTLFFTNDDKARLKMLLNNCEHSGECTKEEGALLRKKYEL